MNHFFKIKTIKLIASLLFAFTATGAQASDCPMNLSDIHKQLQKNNKITLLTNAHIITPSTDSQERALTKINSNLKQYLITLNDEFWGIAAANCFDISLLEKSSSSSLEVIDLKGKYIIPGLQDSHVHNYGMNVDMAYTPLYIDGKINPNHPDFPGPKAMAYRMAYSGITSYLDLSSYTKDTMKLRDEQNNQGFDSNRIPHSNVYMSGGMFALEGGHHGNLSWLVGKDKHINEIITSDITDLKSGPKRNKKITQLVKKNFHRFHPDIMKISYDHNPHRPNKPNIKAFSRSFISDLIRIAKKINPKIKVVCHIGVWQDLIDCMDAKADAVTHIPFSSENDPAYKVPQGIFKKMKKNNLSVITTQSAYMEIGLIKNNLFNTTTIAENCTKGEAGCSCTYDSCKKITETVSHSGHTHFFEDHLINNVVPQPLLESYFDSKPYGGNIWAEWAVVNNNLGYRQKTLRALIHEGVNVLAGTDTMWETTFFGFSLHRELELMWLAGQDATIPERTLSEMQILKTSTSNTHDLLHHFRGRIQPGFKADLLILNKNPLLNIKNTRDIAMIMIDGILFSQEEITTKMRHL